MEYISAFDNAIITFIKDYMTSPLMDKVMVGLTMLGEVGIAWLIAAAIFFFIKGKRRVGAAIILSLVLCFALNDFVLKPLFARPRPFHIMPELELLIKAPHGFSFPSGHSGTSFACATAIFCYQKRIGIAAYIVAFGIALSRVYLSVHYPTDVIVGMVVGILAGILGAWIIKLSMKTSAYQRIAGRRNWEK